MVSTSSSMNDWQKTSGQCCGLYAQSHVTQNRGTEVNSLLGPLDARHSMKLWLCAPFMPIWTCQDSKSASCPLEVSSAQLFHMILQESLSGTYIHARGDYGVMWQPIWPSFWHQFVNRHWDALWWPEGSIMKQLVSRVSNSFPLPRRRWWQGTSVVTGGNVLA